tara:strand:+ start:3233 stop:3418 length:186 start_codon:yes stop_codon:yes gene_type:complete
MADVVTTVKSGEPINNNNSNVLWAYSLMQKNTGVNTGTSIASIETKLTDRFDDPTYYPKQG